MRTLSLALRNLLRNRRRSLATLLAMVLGLVAILLFGGFIRDVTYQLQSDYVQRTGHLQIQRKGYFLYGSGNPALYGIPSYAGILARLKSDPVLAPMLVVATPMLQFGGIAGNFSSGVSRTVYASGVVVEDQDRMEEWNDYHRRVLRQHLALSGTGPDAAVIGTGVARVLGLCAPLGVSDCAAPKEVAGSNGAVLPDDIALLAGSSQTALSVGASASEPRIEILASSVHGAPNVTSVSVVRAEFQGIKELDDVYVRLHLAKAQQLIFGNEPPQVTAIAVQLLHTAQIPEARARLKTILADTKRDDLEVIDFEALNPFYGQTLSMFAAIFGFVSILIGSVVLFTIGNTMSMTVFERTVEIGTVRALGLRRGGVRRMFLAEGIVLGTVGCVIGIIAAMLLAWLVNELGLTWTPPARIEPAPFVLRVAGENLMILAAALGLVCVASLSSILPAARASRMNIVDALRHV
ncbi:MAG: FtsX-like permease family protein [Caldimonas sp.]